MLTRLRLKNFKNFKDAELDLGGFTLLVGTNAVGKSNVCDALRFLSAMGRGYTVTEAIGGHYENGVLQWPGIRGWMSEIAFHSTSSFSISAALKMDGPLQIISGDSPVIERYSIEIDMGRSQDSPIVPKILSECVSIDGDLIPLLESGYSLTTHQLEVKRNGNRIDPDLLKTLSNDQSIIGKTGRFDNSLSRFGEIAILHAINTIRDFDWDPRLMRNSSLPGYTMIGDRGEGLSSVLYSIFQKPNLKENVVDWLNALTPMDVRDLEFVHEESGKIALRMIEGNGRKISAASASDGTLRFLAFLAAYFSAEKSQIYFLDEIENGIHPTRLHLLVQLIEQQAKLGKVQTIATTHSPQVLRYLSEESLQHAYVIYRQDDRPDAQLCRIVDIPHVREAMESSDIGELLESGWLETALSFERDEVAVS